MASVVSQASEYALHHAITYLMNHFVLPELRSFFDEKISDQHLKTFLSKNKDTKWWRQRAREYAFKSLNLTSADFDISLMVDILERAKGFKTRSEMPEGDRVLGSIEGALTAIKKCRNKMCHSTEAAMDQQTFEYWLNQVAEAIAQLGEKGRQNVGEIKAKIQKYLVDDPRSKHSQLFRRRMENFRKKNKATFTETEASREAYERLQHLGMVYIVAGAGDGKTSSSLSILERIKGDTDIPIFEILDFEELQNLDLSFLLPYDQKDHTYIFVDDIFGKTNAISRAAIENSKVFEYLQSYKEHGQLRLLVTMRKGIFKSLASVLEKVGLFHARFRIDLTEGEFLISSSKRKEILLAYVRDAGIIIRDDFSLDMDIKENQVSEYDLQLIADGDGAKKDYIEGYPLACMYFVQSSENIKMGRHFFNRSSRSIMRTELSAMKEADVKRYCVLVYAMLNDGKINTEIVNKKTLRSVCASLATRLTVQELQRITENEKYYFQCLQGSEYGFCHELVLEAVILEYGSNCTEQVLRLSSYRVIRELVRTKHSDEEVELIVPPRLYGELVRRLVREMKSGNVLTVGGHSAMDDKNFVEVFFRETGSYMNSELLGSACLFARALPVEQLLSSGRISNGGKATSFQAAAFFSSDNIIATFIEHFRRKVTDKASMLILADGMVTLAEKGNASKVEETLSVLPPRFFQDRPDKFVAAFLSACYHDQCQTAVCLLRYDEKLDTRILSTRDFTEGLSKAAMTGSDEVILWLLGLEDRIDLDDDDIIKVVLNACMFEHFRTATVLIRHFERSHGHLKSTVRQIFHRCFKDRKLPNIRKP